MLNALTLALAFRWPKASRLTPLLACLAVPHFGRSQTRQTRQTPLRSPTHPHSHTSTHIRISVGIASIRLTRTERLINRRILLLRLRNGCCSALQGTRTRTQFSAYLRSLPLRRATGARPFRLFIRSCASHWIGRDCRTGEKSPASITPNLNAAGVFWISQPHCFCLKASSPCLTLPCRLLVSWSPWWSGLSLVSARRTRGQAYEHSQSAQTHLQHLRDLSCAQGSL